MDRLALVVDANSIQRNRNDNVTGGIHLQIGETHFPSATWQDFPVIIVAWWAQALTALLGGSVDVQDLRFMDGPFFVRVTPLEAGRVQVECWDSQRRDPKNSTTLEVSDLVLAVLKGAARLEAYCVEHGWDDADVIQLRADLAELRRLAPAG